MASTSATTPDRKTAAMYAALEEGIVGRDQVAATDVL